MNFKLLPSILMSCSAFITQAQTAYIEMGGNNSIVNISNGGVFFTDHYNSEAGYEFPAASGNHLVYASSFWFGGKDVNGNLKLAAPTYLSGQELFPGALTTDGSASIQPSVVMAYDAVWPVSQDEIDQHIQNYSNPGYTMPFGIEYWPAHGDVAQDQDFYLAPFVDVNSNGIYDPENGDYPLIRGDWATYIILNDKADVHSESGGDPIGIETHFMFYQYQTSDDLNNTTFVNIKLINRGTQTLYDFTVGSFLDADIGDANDDLMGCDSISNVMYCYNGNSSDAQYGTNPPAIGLKALNHELATVGVYSNFAGPAGMPTNAAGYYLNMTGYHIDGSPRTLGGNGYGGSTPNAFQYHGNPTVSGEWSEVEEGNIPTDKKIMCAIKPFTLEPGAEICLDYAYVIGEGDGNLENVNNLLAACDLVQDFYENQTYTCENYEDVLSAQDEQPIQFSIYPNPSHNQFTVETEGAYSLRVLSLLGQEIADLGTHEGKASIQHDLTAGVYLVEVDQNGAKQLLKLQVE